MTVLPVSSIAPGIHFATLGAGFVETVSKHILFVFFACRARRPQNTRDPKSPPCARRRRAGRTPLPPISSCAIFSRMLAIAKFSIPLRGQVFQQHYALVSVSVSVFCFLFMFPVSVSVFCFLFSRMLALAKFSIPLAFVNHDSSSPTPSSNPC